MSDKSSLAAALKGSNAVFAVTNYWESSSKETEVEQGRAIADVAAELGVEHLIWSTLPNVTKLSNGALPNVEHFDGKADVEEYIRELNVPMTSFVPGFYMSNLKSMMSKVGFPMAEGSGDNKLTKTVMAQGEDGSYTLAWPVPASTKFPLFSAGTDTGKFVASILLHREQLLNANVLGASGWWSGQEIVDTFKHVTGKTAQYVEPPADVWKGFLPNERVAQEMLENFLLIRDYKYFGGDAEQNLAKAIEVGRDFQVSER